MTVTVTTGGRVTIPKPVRDLLGLPGTRVDFIRAEDGRVLLIRADGLIPASRLLTLRGHAEPGLSTDQIMALTRGEP